jgi:hypothetical protein
MLLFTDEFAVFTEFLFERSRYLHSFDLSLIRNIFSHERVQL